MRVIRVGVITLGCVLGLLVLLMVAAALLINPNDYKDRIIAAVRSSTGRTLGLTGDLKLSFFPWLGLELGPASLGNPPGFDATPLASIKHAVLRVKLLPLLRRQLEIGRIDIDGLDLRLRTNAQGRGNWTLASQQNRQPATASAASPQLAGLDGLRIRDSRISYEDLAIDPVDVDVGRVAVGAAVPVKVKLRLMRPGAPAINVDTTFDFTPDVTQQQYRIERLLLALDDSHLKGEATLNIQNAPAVAFALTLDRIDVDRYLAGSGKAGSKPAAQTAASAAAGGAPASPIPVLNGTLAIGSATVTGLTATDISLSMATRAGVLRIAPVKAKVYGGDYAGDITVDETGTAPALGLEQSVSGVDVAQLLQHLAKTQRFSGRGTLHSTLSAHGGGADALLRSLRGRVTVDLTNGALEGMDLWYQINQAMALIQKQALPSGGDSGRTRFDTFKASADVVDGVASTHDLAIVSQNLQVSGEGSANLVNEAIDYRLKATLRQTPGADTRRLAEVPLTVTGTLTAPKVRPDVEGMAKSRLQQELQNRKGDLQQQLQDQLKGLFK